MLNKNLWSAVSFCLKGVCLCGKVFSIWKQHRDHLSRSLRGHLCNVDNVSDLTSPLGGDFVCWCFAPDHIKNRMYCSMRFLRFFLNISMHVVIHYQFYICIQVNIFIKRFCFVIDVKSDIATLEEICPKVNFKGT